MVNISVNILTQGRLNCLERLFAEIAVERQSIIENKSEVNIIDDSRDKDREIVEEWCRIYHFNYHYHVGSISNKRNKAIEVSAYEVILFIDSDCYLTKGILNQHLQLYKEECTDAVLGCVEFTGEKPFFWKVIEQAEFTVPFSFADFIVYAIWGPCANISFRKDALITVNGFKEKYPFDFSGEDVDIGIRLNKSGCKIRCNPKAIAYHDTITWLNPVLFIKKIFRWGKTDYYIMRDHEDLLYPEFIRFNLVVIVLIFLSLVCREAIVLVPLFIVLTPIIHWMFRLTSRNAKRVNIFICIVAFYLKQIFDIGFVFESIMHLKLKFLTKKILYGKRQLEFELSSRIHMSLSILVSLLFAILMFLLWKNWS